VGVENLGWVSRNGSSTRTGWRKDLRADAEKGRFVLHRQSGVTGGKDTFVGRALQTGRILKEWGGTGLPQGLETPVTLRTRNRILKMAQAAVGRKT